MIEDWKNKTERLTEDLHNGEQLYKQLIDIRMDDTDLIVCPEHMGDTLWVVVFASAYIQTHECESVYYVVKESQNEMVSNFPDVGGTITLTDEEMFLLRKYMIVFNLWDQDHIVYAHYRSSLIYKDNKFSFLQYPEGDNMIETRLRWLGIEGNHVPSRMLPLDNGKDTELSDMFNKAVLFMPTAQSVQSIPKPFWKCLAYEYGKKGYSVYTNYNGFDYEYVIEGTKPLSSTIMELARIAPYFVQIIALRSGACDLLAETQANLSILYCYERRDKGVVLEPGDITWDSIHDLIDREELQYYQYLPGETEELINTLVAQARET